MFILQQQLTSQRARAILRMDHFRNLCRLSLLFWATAIVGQNAAAPSPSRQPEVRSTSAQWVTNSAPRPIPSIPSKSYGQIQYGSGSRYEMPVLDPAEITKLDGKDA